MAQQGTYQVDESKLPDWVKRQSASPRQSVFKSSITSVVNTRQAGLVTIVDGSEASATVMRGSLRFELVEGAKLFSDDIIETGRGTRLLRLESVDGDFFDVGPSSRLLLAPPVATAHSSVTARVYLLHGWLKWTTAQAPAVGALLTDGIDLEGLMRSAVVARIDDSTFVFSETGDLSLVDRTVSRSSARVLKSQGFFAQSAGKPNSIAERPPAEFVARLPAAFADTLPARTGLFLGKVVPLREIGEIDYSDAQPWIDAEAPLRRAMVARWRSRADVPAFRKGLIAGLAAHPEWDHTLYPEKVATRRPTVVSSTNSSTSKSP